MTDRKITAQGDGSGVGVGDWVTNDEPMLGEPHEIVGVDDFHWVCCETEGHVVRVPWSDPTLRKAHEPRQQDSRYGR